MPESVAAEDRAESAAAAPAEHWRAPAALGLKSLAGSCIGIVIAAVFFPLWVAVPVAVVLAVWAAGMCVRRPAVTLDSGTLTVRLGAVTRRVPLEEVEAVVLEQGKVLIGKTDKTALSFYAWRKSKLDSWLKVPDISGDVAHAISRAATAAAAKNVTDAPAPRPKKRQASPLLALACAGVLEIAAAIITRVSWPSPAMTVLGVIVALAFGFTGVGTLVFTFWTFLTGTRRKTAA
ncbi:MAG: hypothetical protein FWE35_23670 [Streptosporangiales bacterium]|nr:hypothetical protein [Streptosporangiales bacterium]